MEPVTKACLTWLALCAAVWVGGLWWLAQPGPDSGLAQCTGYDPTTQTSVTAAPGGWEHIQGYDGLVVCAGDGGWVATSQTGR